MAFQRTDPKWGPRAFAVQQPKLFKMLFWECNNFSSWELAIPCLRALNGALLRTKKS